MGMAEDREVFIEDWIATNKPKTLTMTHHIRKALLDGIEYGAEERIEEGKERLTCALNGFLRVKGIALTMKQELIDLEKIQNSDELIIAINTLISKWKKISIQ